jgi:hypothetical protein
MRWCDEQREKVKVSKPESGRHGGWTCRLNAVAVLAWRAQTDCAPLIVGEMQPDATRLTSTLLPNHLQSLFFIQPSSTMNVSIPRAQARPNPRFSD